MTTQRDTIAAIATGASAGGIGVIRISGAGAAAIATAILGRAPRPRHAHYTPVAAADGSTLDHGLLLWFPAPASYTGEDVVELQAHGNPLLLHALLRRTCELGARLARPGEFTERAFLEGRLDLAQAEAVADLIGAGSEAAARAAVRALDGAFSQRVDALRDALITLRVHVEAAIDFTDEEIDFLADRQIADQLQALDAALAALLAEARRGQRLRDGLHAVIVGPPNAGKSSLLNRLAGSERAIVTDLPGTTRDLLRERIVLDGVELLLVDTAGLRDASHDPIEVEGIRRARAEHARADLVLALAECGDAAAEAQLRCEIDPAADVLWVHTKADLHGVPAARIERDGAVHLTLSVRTGDGFDLLLDELRRRAGIDLQGVGTFTARARHVAALEEVAGRLQMAARQLALRAGELVAEELRLAQDALGAITGRFVADDLLGEIFGRFCIGK